MSNNLIARIAVAIVGIPVILWIAYTGGFWLMGLVLVLTVLAAGEYLVGEGLRPLSPGFIGMLLLIVGAVLAQLAALLSFTVNYWIMVVSPAVVALMLIGMFLAVGRSSPAELFARCTRLVWGVLYIGLLYPFVYRVGSGTVYMSGGDSLLFLFGLLWVGDTAAMGIGAWLGKRKLAPTVSPNKTIAGLIGGVLGALAVSVLMYFWKLSHLPLVHILAVGALCSLVGQLGDLVESMWKRSIGIKDSSRLIPGHGGVLDRFDSLLFAAPVMYMYMMLFLS